jgi:RNA polymerase sigma factor (sigma-70 family)
MRNPARGLEPNGRSVSPPSPTNTIRSPGRRRPHESDVDLAVDVGPFLAGAEQSEQLVERARVGGGELEPGEEVERLAQVTAVVQPARHRGEVAEPDGDVLRPVLEDRPALVLGQVPPRRRLADRDERRGLGFGATESRLPFDERSPLGSLDVPLVAREPTQGPRRFRYGVATLDDGQTGNGLEPRTDDRRRADGLPGSGRTSEERDVQGRGHGSKHAVVVFRPGCGAAAAAEGVSTRSAVAASVRVMIAPMAPAPEVSPAPRDAAALFRTEYSRLVRAPRSSDAPAAEHGALAADLHRRAIDALRLLPARQRAVLVLKFYEGLSEAEIASALGISTGSVKTHVHRGIDALRSTLGAGDREEGR